MCMSGGGGASGPTADQIARSEEQDRAHQAQLAIIQGERDNISQQQSALMDSQKVFQGQQSTYADQLTEWTKKATGRTAPTPPAAPGTVTTGADAGLTSDAEAETAASRKRGRASLKIDLTSPTAGSPVGLNIPVG